MTPTAVIGVRELQKNTSQLVRSVQDGEASYRISVQGRPSDVVLTRQASDATAGATLAQLVAAPLYQGKSQPVVDAQLALVEAGRDAAGAVGDR
ncbi:MAG: type II toxin-antitoxin system Phd/YefM family antitoxin [Propionibacteriaceae bacterium]|jgi:prevent-host-death family protein|nr:type II toxin-antitoxin system Phd/YefM family antitoxin [Propionibacteriaceae bacterium]